MTRRTTWLSVTAVLAIAAAGAAQPTFRTETRLVVLHATVKNERGDLVTGLDRSAFRVFENGRPQPVTLFRRDDVPVSLGLLIDNSGSMRTLRARVEAAALAFVRASNPDDEVFVVNFADKVHIDVPMTRDIKAWKRTSRASIRSAARHCEMLCSSPSGTCAATPAAIVASCWS